jgi:hypothetical protein
MPIISVRMAKAFLNIAISLIESRVEFAENGLCRGPQGRIAGVPDVNAQKYTLSILLVRRILKW